MMPPPITSPGLHDLDRIRQVMRVMLAKIEDALEAGKPEAGKEPEWPLGGKASLADTLIRLAELVFKLDDAEKGLRADADMAGVVPAALPLTEGDVALVQHFVTRMRQQHPADFEMKG